MFLSPVYWMKKWTYWIYLFYWIKPHLSNKYFGLDILNDRFRLRLKPDTPPPSRAGGPPKARPTAWNLTQILRLGTASNPTPLGKMPKTWPKKYHFFELFSEKILKIQITVQNTNKKYKLRLRSGPGLSPNSQRKSMRSFTYLLFISGSPLERMRSSCKFGGEPVSFY